MHLMAGHLAQVRHGCLRGVVCRGLQWLHGVQGMAGWGRTGLSLTCMKATQVHPRLGTLMRSSSRRLCRCQTRISPKLQVANTSLYWWGKARSVIFWLCAVWSSSGRSSLPCAAPTSCQSLDEMAAPGPWLICCVPPAAALAAAPRCALSISPYHASEYGSKATAQSASRHRLPL